MHTTFTGVSIFTGQVLNWNFSRTFLQDWHLHHKLVPPLSVLSKAFRIPYSRINGVSLGSLLKNGGRREPGNIHGKNCRLPPPCSCGTNQIAEQNNVYRWHFVYSAKNCQLLRLHLEGWWKQFLDVRKRRKSTESKIKVCCSWFAGSHCSPYFAALSLHVQSASRNSTQLQMPWRRGAKL